jgi:hypothetical protein
VTDLFSGMTDAASGAGIGGGAATLLGRVTAAAGPAASLIPTTLSGAMDGLSDVVDRLGSVYKGFGLGGGLSGLSGLLPTSGLDALGAQYRVAMRSFEQQLALVRSAITNGGIAGLLSADAAAGGRSSLLGGASPLVSSAARLTSGINDFSKLFSAPFGRFFDGPGFGLLG